MSRTTAPRGDALAVSFVYTPKLAPAPAERAALLTVFLSSDVRVPTAPYETVQLSDEEAVVRGRVVLPLRDRGAAGLPHDASLSLCAFAACTNKHGEPTLNQAGSTRFYLAALFKDARTGAGAARMLVPSANDYYKGDVQVTVEFLRAGAAAAPRFAPPTPYDYDGTSAQTARFKALVDAHVALGRMMAAALPPARAIDSMRAIHAPYYRAYGLEMPGVFFALVRAEAPSPAAFYENLLDIVLRRHYPRIASLDEARAHLANEGAGASWRDVSVILAKLLCVFVNYCTYLTDKVVEGHRAGGSAPGLGGLAERLLNWGGGAHDRNVESFDDTFRLTLTGDCEDFTLECAMEARDLEEIEVTTPALRRLQRCRRQMECEMALKGVAGGALSDAMHGPVAFGGHLNARLTPRPLFYKRFARVHVGADAAGGPFGDAAEGEDRPAPWTRTLPVLDLEGTGMLDPDCVADETGPLHAYLSAGAPEAAFKRAKFSVQVPRDEPHVFYRQIQSSMLPDRAARGYGMLEAAYVHQAGGMAVSSAVAFPDSRCEELESVALWAGAELSDELRKWQPRVMSHLHPVPAHTMPTRRAATPGQRHPQLERLIAAVGPTRAIEAGWQRIDYCLRENQLTPERIDALLSVVRARAAPRGRLRRVEYFAEPVTAELSGWLLRFWLVARQ